MNLGPVSLDHYFVTELSVTAREAFDPESDSQARLEEFTVNIDLSPAASIEAEENLWHINLSVHQQPSPESNFPYEFKVVLMGIFKCLAEIEDDTERERFMRINGASMLYGIVREVIRANTSRGPWGPIMVPTLSFYEARNPEIANTGETGEDD